MREMMNSVNLSLRNTCAFDENPKVLAVTYQ